jgi:mono/diheme cytochrome c family protein
MKKLTNNKSMIFTFVNIFSWVFVFSFSLVEHSYADSRFPILKDSKEQVQQGKLLYDQNCASCHKKNLSGTKNWRSVDSDGHTVPPPLNGTAHTWHHSDELLHDIIKHGFNNLIKNYQGKMLGFSDKLNDKEIDSILAYIKTYWPEDIYLHHLDMSKKK